MNLPFGVSRPNMDRFNFLGRNPQTSPAPRRYEFDDRDDDDRQQLSPRLRDVDIESQHQQTPEMAERTNTSRFMLPRWSRPTIPSFLSVASSRRTNAQRQPQPRPSSSHYSGDTEAGTESPKTPRFPSLGIPNLPSTRLNLPHLTRTWTQGSNGPPSRPATARDDPAGRTAFSRAGFPDEAGITEPVPVVPAEHVQTTLGQGARRFLDPEEGHLAELADDGRRRRRHHRRGESDGSRGETETGSGSGSRRSRRHRRHRERERGRRERGPPPKHFLFCFPWIKSRRIRSQILRCFVSGLFLTLLLTVYLALSITKNINNSEFTVLLILIVLFVTIFFCHGLIRLCMLIVRARRTGNGGEDEDADRSRVAMPQMFGPGGYAIPRQPIRVVLARDEEAAGIESEAAKTNPPAYGLWRESVRVDPNRIYWMRNAGPQANVEEEDTLPLGTGGQVGDGGDAGRPREVPRPPSYASDDGVSYVVEAQPRSIAPTTDVPLGPHPAEAGRAARPAEW